MYNEREKLFHHQRLLSPKEAAADLVLLKRLKPNHPRLQEFEFSPERYAGDILMALLDVAHHDDIAINRLRHRQAAAVITVSPEPKEKEDTEKRALKDQFEEKEEEVADLQDQLEEKEEEVADLQDQLEEKEDQIADLEDQLAEEKKSETPVKAPAKKTAAKKSTAKKGGSKKK